MRINPDRIGRACAVLVCLLAVAALAAQHRAVFHETWSDENIHMYVASRVADGASLYGEIPSARPPLAIAPLAGLIALGAPPLLAARIALFVSVILTGVVLLVAGRRLWGAAAGVSAFVLYLFSSTLASRMAFTGMSFVELWASLCLVLAILNRPLLAGLAAGAALMTGQHAAVIVYPRDRTEQSATAAGERGIYQALYPLTRQWLLLCSVIHLRFGGWSRETRRRLCSTTRNESSRAFSSCVPRPRTAR